MFVQSGNVFEQVTPKPLAHRQVYNPGAQAGILKINGSQLCRPWPCKQNALQAPIASLWLSYMKLVVSRPKPSMQRWHRRPASEPYLPEASRRPESEAISEILVS